MTYELVIRSRPREDIFEKHERFIASLTELQNEWGLREGAELPALRDPGTLPMRQVNLSTCFQKGIKATLSYQNRKYLRDEGKFDDYFYVEFDPTQFNYDLLVKNVFERYVESFDAYRGHIGDIAFVQLDFQGSRDTDFRNGVYRIYPVCFFDSELCERAFHQPPTRSRNARLT